MLNKKIFSSKVYHNSAVGKDAVSLCVIWANTGKRLKISSAALKHLGNPPWVSFAENKEGTGIYLQAAENGGFRIGKAGTVYASALIKGLIQDFDLDFAHKSSRTFFGEPGIEPETKNHYVEIMLRDANDANEEERGECS